MKFQKRYSKRLLTDKNKIVELYPPVDKVLSNYRYRARLEWLYDFIDDSKTRKLSNSDLKGFTRNPEKSFIITFGDDIQITILSNRTWTQIQFNPSKVSYQFMCDFLNIMFPGEDGTISKLHCSVDLQQFFSNVLKNFRAKRFRNLRVFADLPRGVDITDESQIFFYSTEYYGSQKQVAIYNKAKERKMLIALTRVEVRFNTKEVVPIKHFSEFKNLSEKVIFDNCWLRTMNGKENLSDNEVLLLKEFEGIQKILNTSLMTTRLIVKKEFEELKYLSLLRALNKSARKHYNFEGAFRHNFNKYLKKSLSVTESQFLSKLKLKREPITISPLIETGPSMPRWTRTRSIRHSTLKTILPPIAPDMIIHPTTS